LVTSELDQLPLRGWVAVGDGIQMIIGPSADAVMAELLGA